MTKPTRFFLNKLFGSKENFSTLFLTEKYEDGRSLPVRPRSSHEPRTGGTARGIKFPSTRGEPGKVEGPSPPKKRTVPRCFALVFVAVVEFRTALCLQRRAESQRSIHWSQLHMSKPFADPPPSIPCQVHPRFARFCEILWSADWCIWGCRSELRDCGFTIPESRF